jgi:hypothetical protein
MIIDCIINLRSVKRPDTSFHLCRNSIPEPPPAWLRFMPNGAPYPNIVVEVEVNNEIDHNLHNESPTKLMRDCQRFFSRETSIRLWIGVKYWKAGKKFWVGYAVRCPDGVGATVTSQFQFPPNHHDINVATNIVYSVPMATVFGPGIAFPQGIGANAVLHIDTDVIRQTILQNI